MLIIIVNTFKVFSSIEHFFFVTNNVFTYFSGYFVHHFIYSLFKWCYQIDYCEIKTSVIEYFCLYKRNSSVFLFINILRLSTYQIFCSHHIELAYSCGWEKLYYLISTFVMRGGFLKSCTLQTLDVGLPLVCCDYH